MTVPPKGEKWSPYTIDASGVATRFLELVGLNEALWQYLVHRDPETALRDLRLDDKAFHALFFKLPESFQELWVSLTPERRDLFLKILHRPIAPQRMAAHRAAIAEETKGYGEYLGDTLAFYAAIALVKITAKLQGFWEQAAWWKTRFWGYVGDEVMRTLVPDYRERESGRVVALGPTAELAQDPGPAPDAAVLDSEKGARLQDFLDHKLSAQQRQVADLSYVYGLSDAEIAQRLGISVQQVYTVRRDIGRKAKDAGLHDD